MLFQAVVKFLSRLVEIKILVSGPSSRKLLEQIRHSLPFGFVKFTWNLEGPQKLTNKLFHEIVSNDSRRLFIVFYRLLILVILT
jgi:hypothetical protein